MNHMVLKPIPYSVKRLLFRCWIRIRIGFCIIYSPTNTFPLFRYTVSLCQNVCRNTKGVLIIFRVIKIIVNCQAGQYDRPIRKASIFCSNRVNNVYLIANGNLGNIISDLMHINRFNGELRNFTLIIVFDPFFCVVKQLFFCCCVIKRNCLYDNSIFIDCTSVILRFMISGVQLCIRVEFCNIRNIEEIRGKCKLISGKICRLITVQIQARTFRSTLIGCDGACRFSNRYNYGKNVIDFGRYVDVNNIFSDFNPLIIDCRIEIMIHPVQDNFIICIIIPNPIISTVVTAKVL